MQTAQVMLFNGPDRQLEAKNFDIPSLKEGEILVENLYTTICGSDIHTFTGMRQELCPTVLGHEIVGKIIAINVQHSGTDLRGKTLAPGDRVTWTVFSSDPSSVNALAGMPQKGKGLFKYGHALATNTDALNGGLSQLCILKQHTGILKIDELIPLSVAATLNCSVATAAGALRLAGHVKGKRVLITGMGHLGITCASMCKTAGAKWVAAADVSADRLAQSAKFGVDEQFNLNNGNETIMMSELFDIVIDMSGSPAAMEIGVDKLSIGGLAIWVGAVFNTRKVAINPEAIIRSLISIKGLHNYNLSDFCYAVEFMEQNWKTFPFEKIVDQEFELKKSDEAFRYAIAHKPLRVGIKI
ncbi:MAG: alcohol dehydrogenase [Pedobacter sp.]|nr:MAG: alcohol dehydrogenase [Pedobacter sp.]